MNDVPLTDGEMRQILDQITRLRTPLKLNGFINGKTVAIKRDNPADTLHFGKEVSLKIYDQREIAAGPKPLPDCPATRVQGEKCSFAKSPGRFYAAD